MVAYRLLASGHDCRLQRPVTLCSLRQKVCLVDFWCLSLPGSLSLKEQNCWFITCQTISSDAMAGEGKGERLLSRMLLFRLDREVLEFFGRGRRYDGSFSECQKSWYLLISTLSTSTFHSCLVVNLWLLCLYDNHSQLDSRYTTCRCPANVP